MSTMTAVTDHLRSHRLMRIGVAITAALLLAAAATWLAASGVELVDAWSELGATGTEIARSTGDTGFQLITERYATPETPPYGQVFARFAAAGTAIVWALRLGGRGVVTATRTARTR